MNIFLWLTLSTSTIFFASYIAYDSEAKDAGLENKFEDGMDWNNYGVWHVDHIIPCANFDLSNPEQQQICFHYTNLQPMWGEKNMQKGARLI